MDRLRAFFFSAIAVPFLFLPSHPAQAWYDHKVVMDWVLPRLEREIPYDWKSPLPEPKRVPRLEYYEVASLLLLNSKADLPSLEAKTPEDLLRFGAEDPDHGMDRDLPDTSDPSDDRKFMGGPTGSGSSGFRHMYWAGWDWKRPIATFQIPPRALGQAPDRIELLANEARDRLRKGDLAWGLRLLGWTIHYLQDLNQPFHAAQLPSIRMIAWSSLFTWPPSEMLGNLLKESTRTVTNYHWAYEGYTRYALTQGERSPFKDCFDTSAGSFLVGSPRDLALEIANQSVDRARRTGRALLRLVGTHLKDPEISIPLNPAQVNEANLFGNPALREPRDELNQVTCESLRLTADATIWITNYVLKSK